MKISFIVNDSKQWMGKIAEQIGSKIEDNKINVPKNFGEGYLKSYWLPNGMVVQFLNAKFNDPITICREEGHNRLFSPIVFYTHEDIITQEIEGEVKNIGYTSPRGVFWPSANIKTTWQYPKEQWINNITIIIDHSKLFVRANNEQSSYINTLVNTDKPFYIFEHITPEMFLLLKDISKLLKIDQLTLPEDLMLEGKINELLGLYFDLVSNRQQSSEVSDIKSRDIDRLFKVKSALMEDLSTIPCIKDLSKSFGFSQSNLQKLYKQVFGKSIYQYALYERMLWAQKMLISEEYSVSEIGYKLGYNNLSHFAKAFRNHFGVNPKTFAQQKSLIKKSNL